MGCCLGLCCMPMGGCLGLGCCMPTGSCLGLACCMHLGGCLGLACCMPMGGCLGLGCMLAHGLLPWLWLLQSLAWQHAHGGLPRPLGLACLGCCMPMPWPWLRAHRGLPRLWLLHAHGGLPSPWLLHALAWQHAYGGLLRPLAAACLGLGCCMPMGGCLGLGYMPLALAACLGCCMPLAALAIALGGRGCLDLGYCMP